MKRARAKNILVNTCCACKMPFDNNMVVCDVCGISVDICSTPDSFICTKSKSFFLCFMWGSSPCIITFTIIFLAILFVCYAYICGFPILIMQTTFFYTTLFWGGPHPHQRVPIQPVDWGPGSPFSRENGGPGVPISGVPILP